MQKLKKWLSTAEKISRNIKNGNLILNVVGSSIKWVYSNEYRGGCHDTSAAIYILLSELGLKPMICIGIVSYCEYEFDHSWLELDGQIYDTAICMPRIPGPPEVPVFASIDLETNQKTALVYGDTSQDGYDDITKNILQMSLGDYSQKLHEADPQKLWKLAKTIGKETGMKINVSKIREKYSNVHRVEVSPQ
jgi:hypothetical protein